LKYGLSNILLPKVHFIKGEITVENGKSFQNATIYVRLEDVSKADAPSKVLSESILKNVNFDSSSAAIPFDLTVESIDDNSDYNVSVHIDLNNNGKLDKGDFINMSSYPIRTPNDFMKINVREIK